MKINGAALWQTGMVLLLLFITCKSVHAQVQEPKDVPADWSEAFPPFQIAGNLYYVGTRDLACYLVTTPKGNILINTGLAASLPLIKKSIETLGFRFNDIKILLTSQVHYDHVGAMAAIKRLTGARMMVNAKDAPVLADGGRSDYELGVHGVQFEPVRADRLLYDGDTITLGSVSLVMLHHPGHTKGSSSFLLTVNDNKRAYRVLIANLPTIITDRRFDAIPAYPDIAQDYAYTLESLKKQSFDLWVAAHGSQFNLPGKHAPGSSHDPTVFADREAYDRLVADLYRAYRKKMEKEHQ
ncbi:subclass B3 metallo-beta-lactamase [Niabella sp.]|uniref:subclass B3 metallo-beta-lactamase n=1 Tax=Niabella sp. TaxID=1962976 RepID=UPI0026341A22|nr:subclass B3 metallo-beta-lactamase [Niabella sp.]